MWFCSVCGRQSYHAAFSSAGRIIFGYLNRWGQCHRRAVKKSLNLLDLLRCADNTLNLIPDRDDLKTNTTLSEEEQLAMVEQVRQEIYVEQSRQ